MTASVAQTDGGYGQNSQFDVDMKQSETYVVEGVEPIAVVGLACRLPGGSSSPEKLWDLLRAGRSGHCEVPSSRYNAAAFYHPSTDRPGSINSSGGYFLQEDIRAFDNAFFGINNLEAMYMDPQQRKLLEVVYESFESAGIPWDRLRGSKTGCYVGNFTIDHTLTQYRDSEYVSRYTASGAGPTILANRISHAFDLKGPSMVLDTACSSSLYGMHIACTALYLRDCDSAVVASANMVQGPDQQQIAAKAGILSSQSTCRAFDASADGYGRGEGVASVLLKRLSDAIRDGDPIRAVIRGTAVNSNGRTNGITLPSADGQESVIRKAYQRAGLATDRTDYVEAHGTGTAVGDPIEMEAISRVFHPRSGRPLPVGSVKTNIGHGEGVSGLSSIIKVVLALENQTIPATIGLETLNPKIKAEAWNLQVNTEPIYCSKNGLQRISVNSFGFGGANSHAILEAASLHVPEAYTDASLPSVPEVRSHLDAQGLLTISARSAASLQQLIEGVRSCKPVVEGLISGRELAQTLATRRSAFSHRAYFHLDPKYSLQDSLHLSRTHTLLDATPSQLPLAYVFTGQGAQWPQMGVELLQYPVFSKTLENLDCYLSSLDQHAPSWTLKSILLSPPDDSLIHDAAYSQPVCTAVQIGLVDLLRDWGVTPRMVLGHSSGEFAAAYTAKYLSARQAIIAAFFRGSVVARSHQRGAMLAAGITSDTAQELIEELHLNDVVRIACVNAPKIITLSGDVEGIDTVLGALQQRKGTARKLRTGHTAYHSHHMQALGQEYEDLLATFWNDGQSQHDPLVYDTSVSMISSVTGKEVDLSWSLGPQYWRSNLESPVLFERATGATFRKANCHILEIGPHPAMRLPIKQTADRLAGVTHAYSSTLSRGADAVQTMIALAGTLYLHGHTLRIDRVNGGQGVKESRLRCINQSLPTYPWNYEHDLWIEPRAVTEFRNRKYPRHDLIGSRMPGLTTSRYLWRNMLDTNETPWIKDHCLGPTTVFPAAGYLAMAMEAVNQVHDIPSIEGSPGAELKDFFFHRAMPFSEERPRKEIFVEMRPYEVSATNSSHQWWSFEVSSVTDATTTKHASGLVALADSEDKIGRIVPDPIFKIEQQATRVWYRKFKDEGLNWGPSFAVMQEIHCDRRRKSPYAKAKVELSQGEDEEPVGVVKYAAHPVDIDALLQTAFVATTSGNVEELRAKVPVTLARARIGAPAIAMMHAKRHMWTIESVSQKYGHGTVHIDAELHDEDGNVLVQIENVRCIAFEGRTPASAEVAQTWRRPLVRMVWKPDITNIGLDASDGIERYVRWFSDSLPVDTDDEKAALAGLLDLVVHHNPNSRIAEFTTGKAPQDSDVYLKLMNASMPLRRYQSYARCVLSKDKLSFNEVTVRPDGSTDVQEQKSSSSAKSFFDVAIVPSELCSSFSKAQVKNELLSNVDTILYGRSDALPSPEIARSKKPHALHVSFNRADLVVSRKNLKALPPGQQDRPTIRLICASTKPPLIACMQQALERDFGCTVERLSLADLTADNSPSRSVFVVALEIEGFILNDLQDEVMERLKIVTDTASVVLWATSADFMQGARPLGAPVLGLARAVMLEQPSLRFAVYDVDDINDAPDVTASHMSRVLRTIMCDPAADLEFVQKDRVVHTSRWVPDERLNYAFHVKQDHQPVPQSLKEAGSFELQIRQPGQFDTLHFAQNTQGRSLTIGSLDVEIEVKCVGMNAKDLYAMAGKVDTKDASCSCEGSGTIRRIGSGVSEFSVGDRVVFMAPGRFGSVTTLPEWACCRLRDDEDFTTASTIPLVFSTAIYALQTRARAERGESVLIHSGAGGLGIAAIQLAQHLSLDIFTTVGSNAKADFLVREYSIPRDHIFDSRSSSFLPGLLAMTEGRGVDIVLNSLTGDLLHESLKAVAEYGRFVEVGKRDIIDKGKLDMSIFERSITITAFDLSSLYRPERPQDSTCWSKLLRGSMSMVRCGTLRPIKPLKVYPAAEIQQAFRNFSLGTRIGKIAVSFEDPEQIVQVVPRKYGKQFDAEKSYLLVGCLGGLGRSISKYMLSRGARKFTFLGRSGTDKAAARALVEDLRADGADVTVVRGDVVSYEDVKTAVDAARDQAPVGGVIHAAMSLSEALWTQMSSRSWRVCLDSKMKGAWNLHNALNEQSLSKSQPRSENLDFFFMTSSISGSVGTATLSNYCAANAFLDAFARYRNNLGLPATAVGFGMIAEVGYLHEHPEIEQLMLRKGIHPITEDELLQIIDLALQNPGSKTAPKSEECMYDTLASTHLLTGCEFIGLEEQRRQGFEGNNHVLDDPRANLFAAALARQTNSSSSSGTGNNNNGSAGAGAGSSLLQEITDALSPSNTGADDGDEVRTETEGDGKAMTMVREIVQKKVANLILLEPEKLKLDTQFAQFGLDSMLAAEFRGFVFKTLEVDVPFMMLLDGGTTVEKLARTILERLKERSQK